MLLTVQHRRYRNRWRDKMGLKKALLAALAGSTFALGSTGAMAVACADIHTIGDWASAGSCTQLDKSWTYTDSNFDASVLVIFGGAPGEHVLQIAGTHDRPTPSTHIGALVTHPNCRIAFDLVANERVQG